MWSKRVVNNTNPDTVDLLETWLNEVIVRLSNIKHIEEEHRLRTEKGRLSKEFLEEQDECDEHNKWETIRLRNS